MYHHKASNAQIFYDQVGIHISFLGSKLLIAWDEIEFCAITPALEKTNGKWHPSPHLKLDDLPFLRLDFKLNNFYAIKQRCNIWIRLWYLLQINFKPMLDEHNQPINQDGVLTLECKLSSFKVSLNEVIDILQAKTKFSTFAHFI